MKNLRIVIAFLLLYSIHFSCKGVQVKDSDLLLAFYNLENLFDTLNSKGNSDGEYTPNGRLQWTSERYEAKLKGLNNVISGISGRYPDILGVCEIENKSVLQDLAEKSNIYNSNSMVHYDSPDERGIDVGLLFDPQKFKLINSQTFPVVLTRDSQDKTRDILLVELEILSNQEHLFIIICHFPSRAGGKTKSEIDRSDAARVCKNIADSLNGKQIVIMGDFNDQPQDNSMKKVLKAENPMNKNKSSLYNLMFTLGNEQGSYKYRGHWEKLDQIIVDSSLLNNRGLDYVEGSLGIHVTDQMLQKGKFAGYPHRTYAGNQYFGGFSDHLPVYMYLRIK